MNELQIAMLQFARARKKIGFTHLEFNECHSSTCSTARLSDLRAMGFVFREEMQRQGDTIRKRFWLVSEPKQFQRKFRRAA